MHPRAMLRRFVQPLKLVSVVVINVILRILSKLRTKLRFNFVNQCLKCFVIASSYRRNAAHSMSGKKNQYGHDIREKGGYYKVGIEVESSEFSTY